MRYIKHILLTFLLLTLAACGSDTAAEQTADATPTLLPTPEPNADATPTEQVAAMTLVTAEATQPIQPTATDSAEGYPVATLPPTPTPASYPEPGASPSATPADGNSYPATDGAYLPITVGQEQTATATATLPPTPTPLPSPTPSPTPIPTIDVAALQTELSAQGKALATTKIGFHVTLPDDRDALDTWMTRLDEAGIPIFLKTVDNAEPLFRAQELMAESGVEHTLVYRATGGVPDYNLPPAEAARLHWEFHRDRFPPELDPSVVWMETINEVDRTKAEWLGQFALETARLSMAEGYRWAAFGFAAGEPEPEHWQTPSMLAFLQLAGENPDQLAVALHEYSYITDALDDAYPYKVGRFQELFRIADANGFPRPTVLITEFGWEYNHIPDTAEALRDIAWVDRLYTQYPEVKGAAIWNLGAGCCYDEISEEVTAFIEPLMRYSLTNSYERPPDDQPAAIDPSRFAR